MDCTTEIKIGVSEDGQRLIVKKVSEEHNHKLHEVRYIKPFDVANDANI